MQTNVGLVKPEISYKTTAVEAHGRKKTTGSDNILRLSDTNFTVTLLY